MLYKTKINKLMSKNYFCLLGKALHFPEKEKEKEKEGEKVCGNESEKKEEGENKESTKESESVTTENENSEDVCKRIDPRHKINLP